MKYIIAISRPTPNGKLHLGHISGPYLRGDILSRHLRNCGHTVHTYSGIDAYESYMEYAGYQSDLNPEDLAHENGMLIKANLDIFDIELDAFIDPVVEPVKSRYLVACKELYDGIDAELIVKSIEPAPYDETHDIARFGAWVSGLCPHCSANVTGFICENCLAVSTPSQLNSVTLNQKGWGGVFPMYLCFI